MHMPSGIIPAWLLIVSAIVTVLAVALAAWRLDRRMLARLDQGLIIGVWFALLCGLYAMSAGVKPGMQVHFLGVMLSVMMFGPWLAIVLLSCVHLTLTLGLGIGAVETLGFNIAACVLLPVAVAAGIHVFTYYRLPRTFPVYIIQVGVGDLLCMWSVAVVLTASLFAFTSYHRHEVLQDFAMVLFMMGGMEAMISTMIASLLVCFLPRALVTFSDEEYLHGK